VEKFDLLINVLRDLQTAGILRHIMLVGSWCQNFYRHIYGNPYVLKYILFYLQYY
jgi:hypothetical protein